MTDEQKVLSFLQGSRPEDTTRFNGLDFIHAFGTGRDALMYSLLFWPRFEQFEEMIFVSSTIESSADRARVLDALQRCSGDTRRVEEEFNIVEVSHLFGTPAGQIDESLSEALSRILMDMWQHRVAALFPNARVRFELIDPAEMDGVVAFTFFQAAH